MAGLVRIAVFNARSFQCRNPNIFTYGLIVFPGFISAGIMENGFIKPPGIGLLIE